MRKPSIAILSLLLASVACSSSGEGSEKPNGSGGGANNGTAGAPGSAEHAQIRFLYQSDWQAHLASCAYIADYRITFGATPIPVTVAIDLTSGAPTAYAEVDGRTYADADVLHIFTCSKSQTSKQTLQLFGKFGTELPLLPMHKYTVTLAGSAASVAEDP